MRGRLLGAADDPEGAAVFNEQVPEALAKGVIDGTIVPYEIVPAIKADELTKFHSETDASEPAIYTTTLLFAMNKARYEGLSARQKEVLDANSGVELSGWAVRWVRKPFRFAAAVRLTSR